MGRFMTATVAAAVCLSSCGSPAADQSSRVPWAAGAETVAELLSDTYNSSDTYEMARFFTSGGTLDLTVWGLGVATTPDEVVQMIQDLYARLPAGARFDSQHLFVSRDGAAIWWYSHDESVSYDWIQTFTFGEQGQTASQAFRSVDVPHRLPALEEHTVLTLSNRYLEAWNGGGSRTLEDVYSSDAVIIDDLRQDEWRGIEEIAPHVAERAAVELGPWPAVFTYRSGAHVEAIVVLQGAGACPMLEASRWSLDGDRIAFETRYLHVPSARRCMRDLEDGWWTTFEIGPPLDENVTGILDSGGLRVDLVNATATQVEFARWMMDRFERAGLGVPEVRAIRFPPSPQCAGRGGLAVESDERYSGLHTVVVCASEDQVDHDASSSSWAPSVVASGLHELSHIWMLDHLDDETRSAFLDRVGLTVWRGSEAVWRERGVEHAAFTIAWGLAGTEDAQYPILPPPECEELTGRFELLTGNTPITRCGET